MIDRAMVRRMTGALRGDTRGNVMLMFALSLPPLLCATGIGVDYTNAMRIRTRLNAAADAAALTASSQGLMDAAPATARQRAIDVFKITLGTIPGLNLNLNDPSQFNVVVTDDSSSGNLRRVTVTFNGTSANNFAGLLGLRTLPVVGTISSMAKTAPDVDFFLLLDTSGSMALPVTRAGIATLKTATGGCAFACHSTNFKTARGANGVVGDYYSVARSYKLRLRVDEEGSAAQAMMKEAKAAAIANNVTYRMSVSRFAEKGNFPKRSFETLYSLGDDLDAAGLAASKIETSLYYGDGEPEKGRKNGDMDTASSEAFDKVNALIAAPGNGSGKSGDPPQAVMLIVTDGMRDEYRPGGRPEVAFDTAKCDMLKNRKIRIAVLYTEYLKEAIDNDPWSVNSTEGNVVNRLPSIETALQKCSSSGLYTKVTSDDDITAALSVLFQRAVATSRLTR